MAEFCHILPKSMNCDTYWTSIIVLVAVCFAYNALIDWLYSEGWGGLTVLLQVAGDLLVVIFFGIVYSWEAATVILSLFAFSGVVMIWGAFRRNNKRKEDDRKETLKATRVSTGNGAASD